MLVTSDLLNPPSDVEARCYYYGLPSRPVLVARSSPTPWEEPTGPEAYLTPKHLRPVGNHALNSNVWEDILAPKLHALLDSMKVKWTSTDVVRIGDAEDSLPPVILWIGVKPNTLERDDGVIVASKCHELLRENNFADIEVEIRQSVVIRSTGPMLLQPTQSFCLWFMVDIHQPLTTTLGFPICAETTPHIEGTSGFFITEGSNTEKLFLVTARHVVLPSGNNKHFSREMASRHRHNVMLFGTVGFDNYLKSIQSEISGKDIMTDLYERSLASAKSPEACKEYQNKLDNTRREREKLEDFQREVTTHWVSPQSRILGHVVLSPPIKRGVGIEKYTEDWAVIEIDPSKINASNFVGNCLELGSPMVTDNLRQMMHFKPNNAAFEFPVDRLLRLQGTLPEDEMRNSSGCDGKDEPCRMVLKRGAATGRTTGRANNICSFAREYNLDDNTTTESKEWAILPFDNTRPFSTAGDSGSVIVDGLGRAGGLLTGGCTTPSSCDLDITYATPVGFLLQRMQDAGFNNPQLEPTLTI